MGNDGWTSKKHIEKDKPHPTSIIVDKDMNNKQYKQYLYTEYNDGFKKTPPKYENDIWIKGQSAELLPSQKCIKALKLNPQTGSFESQYIFMPIAYTDKFIENKINSQPDYAIDKNTQHLTNYFFNHGDKNRKFCNGWQSQNQMIDGHLLKAHFKRLKTEDLMHLKSFYFKCLACYGAYYDGYTNIFNEIQKKLKEIPNNMNKPKCFVRLLKKEYSGYLVSEINTKTNKERFKSLPLKHGEFVDIDDVYEHPDNYFDYYYVTEKEIFKVPHSLVHNRVELIGNDYFNKEVNYNNFHNNFPDDKDLKLMDKGEGFYKKGWEQSFSEFEQAHPESLVNKKLLKYPTPFSHKQLKNIEAEKHENKKNVDNKLGK